MNIINESAKKGILIGAIIALFILQAKNKWRHDDLKAEVTHLSQKIELLENNNESLGKLSEKLANISEANTDALINVTAILISLQIQIKELQKPGYIAYE